VIDIDALSSTVLSSNDSDVLIFDTALKQNELLVL
jgi:hypothetical protein